jgi:hypothetical protein
LFEDMHPPELPGAMRMGGACAVEAPLTAVIARTAAGHTGVIVHGLHGSCQSGSTPGTTR